MPAADKAYLTQLVAARTGLSQPDAAKRVDDVSAQVKAVWVKAHQAADKARKAASYLAFFTAFSMVVGAFIAAVAATIAGHRRDEMLARRPPSAPGRQAASVSAAPRRRGCGRCCRPTG